MSQSARNRECEQERDWVIRKSLQAVTMKKPFIIGEVLFDNFPDGQRVLGGAPFNVAWNLQGMGLTPIFCSAVGDDKEGREIRERMKLGGLDLTGLQISERWPTGKVEVKLNNGQPSFQILEQQAYDGIRLPVWPVSQADHSLLYVGSLAYRCAVSRRTIRHLIENSGLPRFVDINIRPPWFEREWIPNLLGGAQWVKLNQEELAHVAQRECRSSVTRVLVDTARVVGFAAAGFTGLAGIAKMTDHKASKARRLEGAADLMTAGAIAGTVGGLAIAPVILIPVAAAIGILRGAVQFHSGHNGGDVRLSSQGIIDGSRSTSTLLKHSGMQSAAAATLGGLLGTAAACFQLVRGFVDISRGVKSDNRGKEINGLTDVAMATGLLLTAAGVAAPVGIGIAIAAGIAKVSYAVIKPAHKKMDQWMTKHDPALTKAVLTVEKVATPVVKWLHNRVDDAADWIHHALDHDPPNDCAQNPAP